VCRYGCAMACFAPCPCSNIQQSHNTYSAHTYSSHTTNTVLTQHIHNSHNTYATHHSHYLFFSPAAPVPEEKQQHRHRKRERGELGGEGETETVRDKSSVQERGDGEERKSQDVDRMWPRLILTCDVTHSCFVAGHYTHTLPKCNTKLFST